MNYLVKNERILLGQPEKSEAHLDYYDTVENALAWHRKMLDKALTQFLGRVAVFAEVTACIIETLRSGHKVLVAGNGGSAAEAQHFAAELVGRFKRERAPYAVLSLTTDTSILTAVAKLVDVNILGRRRYFPIVRRPGRRGLNQQNTSHFNALTSI